MSVASLSQDLYEFALELRQLAYTMPGGHEDPLVHLSERMVRCAREQAAEQQQHKGAFNSTCRRGGALPL